jgi:hypothetical protein
MYAKSDRRTSPLLQQMGMNQIDPDALEVEIHFIEQRQLANEERIKGVT